MLKIEHKFNSLNLKGKNHPLKYYLDELTKFAKNITKWN